MLTVAGCHVKGSILTRVLRGHAESKPTLGICFQCCFKECFSKYNFLRYCRDTWDAEIIARCLKLCGCIFVWGINILLLIFVSPSVAFYILPMVIMHGIVFACVKVVDVWIISAKVGFEVLTAVSTKMAVAWDVAPCSLVQVHQCFRGPCCLHHQGPHSPNDGGSKDLWNVGKLLPDNTVLQPRRQPF
jgi:hypothetical protein